MGIFFDLIPLIGVNVDAENIQTDWYSKLRNIVLLVLPSPQNFRSIQLHPGKIKTYISY